ncbi:unnamed protein product [Darwinula stevensoni]|uniref:Uncharacterized protein n=1 Tax=Darwinula stevensoni TaxID=69355 RepID=A0A7R9A3J3_9CRUS|nr:unnamed protein product [Darwinula stevensoni]CAG0890799.1 unnamed protein product [Darwinula stevensoni]
MVKLLEPENSEMLRKVDILPLIQRAADLLKRVIIIVGEDENSGTVDIKREKIIIKCKGLDFIHYWQRYRCKGTFVPEDDYEEWIGIIFAWDSSSAQELPNIVPLVQNFKHQTYRHNRLDHLDRFDRLDRLDILNRLNLLSRSDRLNLLDRLNRLDLLDLKEKSKDALWISTKNLPSLYKKGVVLPYVEKITFHGKMPVTFRFHAVPLLWQVDRVIAGLSPLSTSEREFQISLLKFT